MKFSRESFRRKFGIVDLGVWLLAFGTALQGLLDLLWRDFDPGHQPIESLAVQIPARPLFACLVGIGLLVAGAGFFSQRSFPIATAARAALYTVVGLFSLPRFYTLSHRYGFHLTIILGVIGEILMQFIVVAGCIALNSFSPRRGSTSLMWQWIIRIIFGLSGLLFGMGHFINTKGVVHMIPAWMPFSASFWVRLSGACFALAGISILAGVMAARAARFLAFMFLAFEIILIPVLFQYPHVHQAWGASAYNLTVAGAVCIYSAILAQRNQKVANIVDQHNVLASSPVH